MRAVLLVLLSVLDAAAGEPRIPSPSPKTDAASVARPAREAHHDLDAWRTGQGLPTPTVQSLRQDRAGYLVLGLHGSLARFDGVRFSALPHAPALLAESQVRSLFEDADGAWWVSTLGEGLLRVATNGSQRFGLRDGLPSPNVADVCRDGEGTLWIGTTGGLVFAAARPPGTQQAGAPGALQLVSDDEGRATPADVVQLACDRAGVWVATGTTAPVHASRDGRVVPLAVRFADGTRVVAAANAIAIGRDGSLWIGGSGGGLAHVVGETVRVWRPGADVPAGRAMAILEDAEGEIWFGSWSDGLARLADDRVVRYGTADGLASNSVTSLTQDREGGVWVGTTGGLTRISRRPFRTLPLGAEFSKNLPTAVLAARDGTVWVGTQGGGLEQLDASGQRLRALRQPDLPSDEVSALAEATDGTLYVGTNGGPARLAGGATVTPLPPGLGHRAQPLIGTRDGQVWFRQSSSVVRVDPAGAVHDVPFSGTSGELGITLALCEARDGTVWVVARGTLHVFVDGQLRAVATVPGRPSARVYTVTDSADGSLWLGTAEGIVHIPPSVTAGLQGDARRGHASSVAHPPPLPKSFEQLGPNEGVGRLVGALAEDDQGHLWAGTVSGLLRFPATSRPVAPDDARPLPLRWGTESGLRSADFSYPARPAAARTRDGSLWLASSTEIVVVDRPAVAERRPPPPVSIETLRVDGRDVPLASANDPSAGPAPVSIAAGSHRIEIAFTALTFHAPGLVRFRTMLEGFDAQWTERIDRRSVELTNLRPGRYRFRVQAANESGVWNREGAVLAFSCAPRLHETWWFRVCAAVIALGLIPGGAHAVRVRRLRTRFAALTSERSRIAREWHDTLEQSLTAVALHLKAAEELLRAGQSDGAGEHVRSARAMTRHASTDARHAVWDLRGRGGRHEDLASALRQAVAQAEATGSVLGRLVLEGTVRPLGVEVETALLRMAQEALTNTLKHAAASTVTVTLAFRRGAVALSIEDDGRGMPAQPRADGLGLLGMRERAEWIGAHLAIVDPGGRGTRIQVELDAHDSGEVE